VEAALVVEVAVLPLAAVVVVAAAVVTSLLVALILGLVIKSILDQWNYVLLLSLLHVQV
jgi:hypothetical protein